MKNYPQLHSLSTAGIIHHQENDYLFHPERTDFIGDSASGKTIIADLLQLIFVGSTAFRSATATLKERRDPNGLVLTTSGRGSNIAYAFLNIEMANEQYVVIGAYIESTDAHTKPFIIQTSIDIENGKLAPMPRPLKASDFKNDDYIYDLDELTNVMEDKQLIFKKWEKISPYHRILYRNNILPLNLASNDKTLSDYAKIIQSFSRAKTLDTKDSKSLLNFLFGQEKEKELYGKYIQIVKELENTISSYGQNLDAIRLLTNKYQKISSLKTLLDNKNKSEKESLSNELIHCRMECKRLSDSVSSETKKMLTAFYCLRQLSDAAKKDIDRSQKTKNDIEKNVEKVFQSFSAIQHELKVLKEVQKLLENLHIEESELEPLYQDYRKRKEQYSILQELITKLSVKNLQSFFEHSEWIRGMQTGNEYYGKRITEIKSRLEHLILLSEFSDINNPDSLVRWAMSLNRPLTKTEESLLLHFQTLKRTEPINPVKGNQFLPSPEALFTNPEIIDRNTGFWINLEGIWEYVDYVSEQKFNTNNKENLNKYFKSQTQSIESQKKQLENERKNLTYVSNILAELTNAAQAIELYRQKDVLEDFKEIEQLNTGVDKMQSYLSCLQRQETIEYDHGQYQQIYNEALREQNKNQSILEKLPAKIKKAEELLQKMDAEKPLLEEIIKWFSINPSYSYELNFYLDAEDKVEWFQTEVEVLQKDIGDVEKLRNDKSGLDDIERQRIQKEKDFFSHYKELPSADSETTSEQVRTLKDRYIGEKNKYNIRFEDIVGEFIPNESYRFEDENKDFSDLIAHLLPDIFGQEKVIEEEAINRIEAHLKKINDKNRELNDRKIQKISDLLDDVFAAVSAQRDTVRNINRFFNDGEKRISGNYRLNLEQKDAREFPVEWLSGFKQIATAINLFDISVAGNRQDAFISIEDKITHSFRELTHNNNLNADIHDILNPNSYMELNLDMKDLKGKSNKGSTGQIYAAIALLCIARLSIVGNKHEKATGIRFMPIDEAEGLGSNFDMLNEIAHKYGYQIVTFAINPLGRYDGQYIYILHRNPDADTDINYTPMAVYSKKDIDDELKEIIET